MDRGHLWSQKWCRK